MPDHGSFALPSSPGAGRPLQTRLTEPFTRSTTPSLLEGQSFLYRCPSPVSWLDCLGGIHNNPSINTTPPRVSRATLPLVNTSQTLIHTTNMDSMRSLNSSLPSSGSTRTAPPEQLLQAFRNAALSVTNLYKSAVTDQNVSRQAGYQEALEDLLSFLDRENLGLQDGEGWRVRQWATERYDGSTHQQGAESDDDRSEGEPRPRSVSPARDHPREPTPSQPEPTKAESATETEEPHLSSAETTTPVFHFSGTTRANTSDDMQTDEEASEGVEASSSTPSTAPIRLEVMNNRGSRTPHRHGNQRHGTRPPTSNREFTFTAGTKRKLQFPDFFDISNIGPRDGSGSTKRGRLS